MPRPGKESDRPCVLGVSRVADNEQSLLISFDERPTDAQLRLLHDLGRLITRGAPFRFDDWASDQQGCDMETGAPGIGSFANALQVWAVYQVEPVSVATAAAVFNIEPRRIIEAVEWHHYMLLSGPHDDYTRLMIEHDGE